MKKNHKYQYLILVSLILVAWYRNSVSHVSTIQLRLINKCNTDFESYFISVANFKTVCLHPIVTYTYVLSFLTHVLGDMKNLFFYHYYICIIQYNGDTIEVISTINISIKYLMMIWFLVFNATFSNISAISWRPVLVVEEAGVPEEIHRPWTSNW